MKSLFMAMSAQTSGREPQYPPSSSPPTIQPARPLTVTVSQTFTITVLLREDRRKFVQGLIEAVLKKLWWALPFVFVCVCPSWSSPLSYLKLLCLFWEIQPCHCSLLPCFVLVLLPFFLRRARDRMWLLSQNRALQGSLMVDLPSTVFTSTCRPLSFLEGRGSSASAGYEVLWERLAHLCASVRPVCGPSSCPIFQVTSAESPFKKWTVVLSSHTFIKMKWHFSVVLPRVSGRSVLLFSPSIHDCDRDRKAELDPFGD